MLPISRESALVQVAGNGDALLKEQERQYSGQHQTIIIGTAMLSGKIASGLVLCWALCAADTAADWVRQGQASRAKGDAAAALQAFEKALSLDPKSPQIEDEIGFILAATNRRDEAIAHFEKAIQLDPRFASAHYHLGVAY